MTVRVGINGFGRIGRQFYKATRGKDIDVVAVNDLGDLETMAHLLRYDSVHGRLGQEVTITDGGMRVGDDEFEVLSIREPSELPWEDRRVDVVIESTRFFTERDKAAAHLEAGAKTVIVSAPSKGADATFVYGVNHDTFDPAEHQVISNASCTTNCFVPMVKVLDDAFTVQRGLMTTVHAYTTEQLLIDGPHSDLRRARAAGINIVPTSTGAARATGLVLQAMQGRLDGTALRVPIPDGSITDFVAILDGEPAVDEVNNAFAKAAEQGPLAGVLEYSDAPLVSSDIVGSPASCVFDSQMTIVLGNLVKVLGWYDNEWGYSSRLADLTAHVGASL